MPRLRIDWYGDFLGDGSLARVNRHLARAVVARGDTQVVPYGEPMAGVDEAIGRERAEAPDEDLPLTVLRHRWPPRFMNPRRGRYVHMQPWEFGSAPRAWVDKLRARADEVWCYSRHVRAGYIEAGLEPERVQVVPLGFDPDVYHANVSAIPTDNPDACIFLFVGGLIPRKDVSRVVEAYTRAFTPRDPVALLIKADRTLGMYGDEPVAEQLRGLQALATIPPIRFIEAHLSDADMARFYRTATALVQPYRGEGFGLPMLEAMACGTPAIVSGGGSTDDFIDDTVGYVLPARRVGLGHAVDGVELAGEGWWLEASTEALVSTMQRIVANRDDARAKGAAAAARAQAGWTWTHAAEQLVRRLDAVQRRAPRAPRDAYRDELRAYEWRGFSPNGEDGVLLELCSRLRVTDRSFVEIGAGNGATSLSRLLAVRYGWSGLLIEADATAAGELEKTYAELPKVRTVRASVTPANVAGLLGAQGVADEFDLLVLGDPSRSVDLWAALAGYRPRLVALASGPGVAANAAGNYARIGTETAERTAFFVRRDLLPATGFAETSA